MEKLGRCSERRVLLERQYLSAYVDVDTGSPSLNLFFVPFLFPSLQQQSPDERKDREEMEVRWLGPAIRQ